MVILKELCRLLLSLSPPSFLSPSCRVRDKIGQSDFSKSGQYYAFLSMLLIVNKHMNKKIDKRMTVETKPVSVAGELQQN